MNEVVRRVAIVAAMPEELNALLQAMPPGHQVQRAGRTFWLSHWCGHEVVAVLSRIGKVAAATTSTLLLTEFGVDRVLFTGVAGGPGRRRAGGRCGGGRCLVAA
jgi:adenosylhomocysteine nucleosidase